MRSPSAPSGYLSGGRQEGIRLASSPEEPAMVTSTLEDSLLLLL